MENENSIKRELKLGGKVTFFLLEPFVDFVIRHSIKRKYYEYMDRKLEEDRRRS